MRRVIESNKTNIEWTDLSWNPKTGCEGNAETGCLSWCYGYEIYSRFHRSYKPTWHPERLEEPFHVRKPSRIFTCTVSDLFAPSTREDWVEQIVDVIRQCPQHTFQILTKWPENIPNISFPSNLWLGVTVTRQSEIHRIESLMIPDAKVKFVSFEPLLGGIWVSLLDMDWIIIGARTGRHPFQPESRWIGSLIRTARARHIPIFLKRNLNWPTVIMNFPRGQGV